MTWNLILSTKVVCSKCWFKSIEDNSTESLEGLDLRKVFLAYEKKIKEVRGLEPSELLECEFQTHIVDGNWRSRPAVLLALFLIRNLGSFSVSDIQIKSSEETVRKLQNFIEEFVDRLQAVRLDLQKMKQQQGQAMIDLQILMGHQDEKIRGLEEENQRVRRELEQALD